MRAPLPKVGLSPEAVPAVARMPSELWVDILTRLPAQDLYLGPGQTSRALRRCAQEAAAAFAPPRAPGAVRDLDLAWGHVAAKARLHQSLSLKPLTLGGHQGHVCGVVLSKDGRSAYTADAGGTARRFVLLPPPGRRLPGPLEPQSVKLCQTLFEHFTDICMQPAEQYLWLASFCGIFAVNLTDNAQRLNALGQSWADAAFCVDISADGQTILTGARKGRLNLWQFGVWNAPCLTLDTPSMHVVPAGMAFFTHCAIAPDASFAVGLHATGHSFLWRLHASSPQAFYMGDKPATTMCLSPDGRLLATSCIDGYIYLRDMLAEVPFVPIMAFVCVHDRAASAVAFSPDGNYLAVGLESGDIYVWAFRQSGAELGPRIGGHIKSPVMSLAWAQDQQSLLSGAAGAEPVRLWAVPKLG